jgi:hypothetical protein
MGECIYNFLLRNFIDRAAILSSMGYFKHLGAPWFFTTRSLLQQTHVKRKKTKTKKNEVKITNVILINL